MADAGRAVARSRGPLLAATLLGAAVALVLLRATGRDESAILPFLAALAGWWPAALWLAAASGLGEATLRILDRRGPASGGFALGVAILLLLDGGLGRLGLLGRPLAIALLLPPAACGAASLVARLRAARPRLSWWALPIAAPAAALAVAAASAPGWLWASEFGGYDALSYHLALPAEWWRAGRITGPEHVVYGFLPSAVEAAFLHVMTLVGDPRAAGSACQALHAGLALAAAVEVGRLAGIGLEGAGARIARGLGAALLLATPWVVVTGSLAYDEAAVLLLLAAAWRAAQDPRTRVRAAFLAGSAAAAKATALGFVVLPIGALILFTTLRKPVPRRAVVALLAAGAAGLLPLLPWLLGNLAATGNPLFPFATDLFGSGHWSAEQVARWRHGHGHAGEGFALWREFLGYGLGPAPEPGAPWAPQWSLLPWLGAAALLLQLRIPRPPGGAPGALARQAAAILAIQLLFWWGATHRKSRFLLPAAVPLVVVAARLPGRRGTPDPRREAVLIGAATVGAMLPPLLLLKEQAGRPAAAIDAADVFTGTAIERELARRAPDDPGRAELRALAPPTWWIDHALPDDARILLVGEAATYWYGRDDLCFATTWDAAAGDGFAALVAAAESGAALPFDHVLVNATMLAVWERAGWIDPRLRRDLVLPWLDRSATLLRAFPDGTSLWRVGPA